MCSLSPTNPVSVASGGTASLTATLTVPSTAIPGTYNINITTQDASGAPSHSFSVVLTVAQDFRLTSSTPSQRVTAGQTSGAYKPECPARGRIVHRGSDACLLDRNSCRGAVHVQPTHGGYSRKLCGRSGDEYFDRGKQDWSAAAFYSRLDVLCAVVDLARGRNRSKLGGRRAGRRRLRILGSIATLLFSGILLSCGAVSNGGSGLPKGNQPVTYRITVTGTSAGTAVDAGRSARVTLVVD
jgi:hypothetical protein